MLVSWSPRNVFVAMPSCTAVDRLMAMLPREGRKGAWGHDSSLGEVAKAVYHWRPAVA